MSRLDREKGSVVKYIATVITLFMVASLCMLMAGCGKAAQDIPQTGEANAIEFDSANERSKLTEEQAYDAVINYNKTIGSGYDEEVNSEGYLEYWDVSTNENGEIVVLYRSYTGAQIRYYVNSITGDTYVTELVPGIIDEEQKTDETFNIRDYMNN